MKGIINNLDNLDLANPSLRYALTHNGTVNCDDIFAAVILDINYKGNLKLIRTANVSEHLENSDLIIFGTGEGRFDPHASNSLLRENGIKYSSAGLVWRVFGKSILRKCDAPGKYLDIVAEKIDTKFIRFIDYYCSGEINAIDSNNVFSAQFNLLVSSNCSNEVFEEKFRKAYPIFENVLKKEILIWKGKASYSKSNKHKH